MGIEKKIAFAGPWIGEFGWEILTWVPYLRKLSREYDKMYISTFEGMEALYTGFHCKVEFVPHRYPERIDDWSNKAMVPLIPDDVTLNIEPFKEYRIDGEYVRYGTPVAKDNDGSPVNVGVLFHARKCEKGAYKNWALEKWKKLAKEFPGAMSIGSDDDMVPSGRAYTGGDLATLMDVIASAAVVIGGSSGVMHLALMCGTPVVTWGDCNNFGESLKERYMKTWNPFGTPVTWVGDTWDPEVEQIMEALKPKNIPDPALLSVLHDAVESGQYLISTAFVGERDGKEALLSQCAASHFPDHMLDQAAKQMIQDVNGSIAQVKAEKRPVSWH